MKSSLKTGFIFQFLLYFSITLIILGSIQFVVGGLRLFNASEENYEKLSPEKVYTVPETTFFIPEKTLAKNNEEEQPYYVAESRENKNTLNAPVAPTQIKKESTSTQETVQLVRSTKKESTKKKRTSPVEINIAPEEEDAPKGYQETIKTVVTGRYFIDALWNFPIIIDTERVEPRGQMYNESITLGSRMTNLAEVSKVLVHEIGHMIDIYTFRQGLRKSDISEEFYKISWKDPTTIKAGVPQASFVSGYASTNQYEDFAESFAMYVFHNKEFLKRTETNDYLKQKYNFLKTKVFGDAFLGTAYEKDPIPRKVWDITKIALRGNNIDVVFAWIQHNMAYRS